MGVWDDAFAAVVRTGAGIDPKAVAGWADSLARALLDARNNDEFAGLASHVAAPVLARLSTADRHRHEVGVVYRLNDGGIAIEPLAARIAGDVIRLRMIVSYRTSATAPGGERSPYHWREAWTVEAPLAGAFTVPEAVSCSICNAPIELLAVRCAYCHTRAAPNGTAETGLLVVDLTPA